MKIKEAMITDVKTARPDIKIRKAAEIMTQFRIGSLVIVSGSGSVKGILTERDIMKNVVATGRSGDDVTAEEIMTTDLVTISQEDSLEDAADLMTEHQVKKLPVIEDNKLVGIITASDLVKYEKNLIEKISTLLASSGGLAIGG